MQIVATRKLKGRRTMRANTELAYSYLIAMMYTSTEPRAFGVELGFSSFRTGYALEFGSINCSHGFLNSKTKNAA
jgi:hypothetical protein